jgi:hypothetical protein
MKKRISMSRAGRRLPALVRIMQLISEIVINQNSKYAEKLPEIIFWDMSKIFEFMRKK